MNKAFVKEDAHEEEDAQPSAPALPHGAKNYMTRRGYGLLKAELEQLVKSERPALVLQATVDAAVRTLFWFADDALIGSAGAAAKLEWRPRSVGRYRLRVVDDHGRAEERWVEIGTRR